LQLSICSGCFIVANLANFGNTKFFEHLWMITSLTTWENWPKSTHFLLVGCILSLSHLAPPSTSFQPSQEKMQNFRTFLYGCRDFFGGYGRFQE
jgi:hypothetical protein